jgi:hypothetical protein
LDKLVLSEIQALQRNTEETYEDAPRPKERTAASSTRPVREKPKQERRQPRVQQEETEQWDRAEDLNSMAAGNEMLTEEEQLFINNTVEWLRNRENRDVVMASIWSRVVDSDPESFYEPPDNDGGDAAARAAQPPDQSEQAHNDGSGESEI